MVNDGMTFAERMKFLMEERGLIQAELVRLVSRHRKVHESTVNHWYHGHAKPALEYILPLSDALGVTSDRLLGRIRDSESAPSAPSIDVDELARRADAALRAARELHEAVSSSTRIGAARS